MARGGQGPAADRVSTPQLPGAQPSPFFFPVPVSVSHHPCPRVIVFLHPPTWYVCTACLASADFYFATLALRVWIQMAELFHRKEAVIVLRNLEAPYLDIILV